MITKSAQKAYRQNILRRTRNLQRKKALKNAIKKYRKLVQAGDLKSAQNELPKVYKILDKTAKVNLIKKNKASRLKSRLTALVNKK